MARTGIRIFTLLSLLFLSICSLPLYAADQTLREDVLARYERALFDTEDLNVYEKDTFEVIPRLGVVSEAILGDDYETASRLLGEIESDFNTLRNSKPAQWKRAFRLEWLEIYLDIFQKYAFMALLAYLFIRIPYFRKQLKTDRLSAKARLWLVLATSGSACFLSAFDLIRYGKSAWTFMDIQVVLVTVSGLIGGVIAGTGAGLVLAGIRWLLSPDYFLYGTVVIGAGLIGGITSRYFKSYRTMLRLSVLAGVLAGLYHGLLIYLPQLNTLPFYLVVLSIGVISFLEGCAVFIFFAIVSGVLNEDHKREVERELLKTKLLFLQAQISPHFLYNALNAISAVCRKEKAMGARELVLSLADFLRRTVRRVDELVSLEEEMSYIDSYLQIEKARFQDRLEVVKETRINEDLWHLRLPFLILQPLVENSVKHGIQKKTDGGRLRIQLGEDENDLVVRISDNGIGMDEEKLKSLRAGTIKGEGLGLGVGNINQRMERMYGQKYKLQYQSRAGEGTEVTVRFPKSQGKVKVAA